MTSPGPKTPGGWPITLIVALLLLATLAPLLIQLSHALLPLVLALGFVVAVLRLVFYHTRRF